MRYHKKIILFMILLIIVIMIWSILPIDKNTLKYDKDYNSYVCNGEKYSVTNVVYNGQVKGHLLKNWVLYLSNLDDGKQHKGFLITKFEEPYNVGYNVLFATNCKKVIDAPSFVKENDYTHKIYMFDKTTMIIELRDANIIGEKIYIKPIKK